MGHSLLFAILESPVAIQAGAISGASFLIMYTCEPSLLPEIILAAPISGMCFGETT